MRFWALPILFPLLLSGCAVTAPLRGTPAIPPLSKPATIALSAPGRIAWPSAHRGHPENFPDNSIEGIRAGAEAGLPLLEVDVRMNRSGVLFLFHDGELRPGNFSGPASLERRSPESLTAGEIASIRIPGAEKAKVPLFSAALEAVRDTNSALELDVKHERESVVRTILAKARELQAEGSIVVQAESPDTIALITAEFREVKTIYRCKSNADLERAIALHPTAVELEGWYDKQAVATLHESGIRALVNLAESPADGPTAWKGLFDLGVDVVMTNHPQEMLEWLKHWGAGG